jgi:threonine/homoserine/homoserine lactone efflux protein
VTLSYVVLGASYGFAAAVQPGPFQAYLVAETLVQGWRRTAPAALAPLVSDVPIVALVLVVLSRLPVLLLRALQVGGGVFLLYLAVGAARSAYRYRPGAGAPARVTFAKAVVINLVNPNPYLGWGLVLGPMAVTAWRRDPRLAVGLVTAFYGALVLGTAAIVAVLAAARLLGPRVGRGLVAASALALGGFGLYQLWSGLAAGSGAPG